MSASYLFSNDDSRSTITSGHDYDTDADALQARVEELEALIRLHDHTSFDEIDIAEGALSDYDVESTTSAAGVRPRPTIRTRDQRQQRPTHTMIRSVTGDSSMLPSSVSSSSDGGGHYYDPIDESDYGADGNAIDYDQDEYGYDDNEGHQPQQMDADYEDDDDETKVDNDILTSISNAAIYVLPTISTAAYQHDVFQVPEARTMRDLQDPVLPTKDLSVHAPEELNTHMYVFVQFSEISDMLQGLMVVFSDYKYSARMHMSLIFTSQSRPSLPKSNAPNPGLYPRHTQMPHTHVS